MHTGLSAPRGWRLLASLQLGRRDRPDPFVREPRMTAGFAPNLQPKVVWQPLYPAGPYLLSQIPGARWQDFHVICEGKKMGFSREQALPWWPHSGGQRPDSNSCNVLLIFGTVMTSFYLDVVIKDKLNLTLIQLPLPLPLSSPFRGPLATHYQPLFLLVLPSEHFPQHRSQQP